MDVPSLGSGAVVKSLYFFNSSSVIGVFRGGAVVESIMACNLCSSVTEGGDGDLDIKE